MHWRNLNTETGKSEQTKFAQIFLSQYKDFYRVCCKAFQEFNTKLDHAELLSISIVLLPIMLYFIYT